MKKVCIILIIICLMVATGIITHRVTSEMTRVKIIQEIEIDGVNEIDNGIITLKINGEYYDYEYEYNEGFKTIQERINNGENVNEWAEIIK